MGHLFSQLPQFLMVPINEILTKITNLLFDLELSTGRGHLVRPEGLLEK